MAWRKPADLNEWLRIVHRHKGKFIFTALPVMIIVVWVSVLYIPRQYLAQAKFQRFNDPALREMGNRTIGRNLATVRTKMRQDLTGREAIQQVIRDLQLDRALPHTPDGQLTSQGQIQLQTMVREFQSSIWYSYQVRSDAVDQIVVSMNHADRELAPQFVNKLVSNYISQTRQQLDAMLLGAKDFFQREVDKYDARVSELDAKKLRFGLDHPGLLPDDPGNVQNRLIELEAKLEALDNELAVKVERRQSLADWIEQQPEFIEKQQIVENPTYTAMMEKRTALEAELENHLYHWNRTEEHPAVVKVRRRIQELDKEMADLQREVAGGKELQPNVQKLEAQREAKLLVGEVEVLQRRRNELRSEVERYQVMERKFFVLRNEYLRLERELTEARRQLSFWNENLQSTQLALAAEISERGVRLQMLESADERARPSRPTVMGILTIALGLGLGAGGAVVVLMELTNHSFSGVEHAVDDLKLPVLGTINEIVTPSRVLRQRVVAWGVMPVSGALLGLVLLASFYLAFLSLERPHDYAKLVNQPRQFISQTLLGRI